MMRTSNSLLRDNDGDEHQETSEGFRERRAPRAPNSSGGMRNCKAVRAPKEKLKWLELVTTLQKMTRNRGKGCPERERQGMTR